MNRILVSFFLMFLLLEPVIAHEVPKKAKAFFISPPDGATVTNPITLKFGINGYLIAPAGENIHKAGHYHVLIDLQHDLSMDEPIPRDKQHLHFDQGETQTTINLSPGQHTLQLVVGDEEHEPFEELMSKKIKIFVKK